MNSLVEYYQNYNRSVTRVALRELRDARIESNHEIVADICRFFTHDGDFDTIKHKVFMRYGTQIVHGKKNSVNLWDGGFNQYYVPNIIARPGEYDKLEAGVYEIIVTGAGHMIANAIACLFTSPENNFEFLSGDKNSSDCEDIIVENREQCGFNQALTQADYIASCVGSCLVHVFPKDEWLSYSVVWPSHVRVIFGDKISCITSRGLQSRGVDYTDLEDASAVVIALSQADMTDRNSEPDKRLYLAYVGACDDYPMGRMVRYRSNEYWPIPDDPQQIIWEYERDGIPCNPMTYVAKKSAPNTGIGGGYEYPIAVIRGDLKFGSESLIPTTSSFYENCIEIETAWSSLLRNGVKAARGKDVITVAQSGDQLPYSLDVVVCPPGSQYQYYTGNQGGVQACADTINSLTRSVAASRGVPDYVVVGAAPSAPESGTALAIRTRPLIDSRDRRIAMNRSSVSKIFEIESALIYEMFPEKTEKVFSGVKQVWTPGAYQIPQDEAQFLLNLKTRRDLEVADQVEVFRKANGLRTANEAMDQMLLMEERDPDFRGVTKESKTQEQQTHDLGVKDDNVDTAD